MSDDVSYEEVNMNTQERKRVPSKVLRTTKVRLSEPVPDVEAVSMTPKSLI